MSTVEGIQCPCHGNHEGVEIKNEIFEVDVDTLYHYLFNQHSEVMKKVFELRCMTNVTMTPLEKNADGSTRYCR